MVSSCAAKRKNAVLSAPNVILMLFFRFHPRKCLIISRYIAIYWIFLRIFARIFRGRSISSYLAVNEIDGAARRSRWKMNAEGRFDEMKRRKSSKKAAEVAKGEWESEEMTRPMKAK